MEQPGHFIEIQPRYDPQIREERAINLPCFRFALFYRADSWPDSICTSLLRSCKSSSDLGGRGENLVAAYSAPVDFTVEATFVMR